MANEGTIAASLALNKSGTSISLPLGPLSFTVSGTGYTQDRISVGITEQTFTNINTTAGGYCLVINRDATNYVQIRRATGQSATIRILPGEFALFRLDASSASVPYIIANAAPCDCELLVLSA
jgi:hypothetical protein